MTDQQLVARARAGHPIAERELYERHVDRIFRLAFRMTGEEDLARELTQQTFARAFARLDQFRGDAALATWLHRIATRVILNGLRGRRRRAGREIALPDGLAAERRPAADPDLRDALHAAIDALPDPYRLVFVMHDVEGYTHEEIGSALAVAEGTSKARLSRARAKLRAVLARFRPAA